MQVKTEKTAVHHFEIWKILLALLLLLVVVGGLYVWSTTPNAYALYLDDREIAFIADKAEIQQMFQSMIEEMSQKHQKELIVEQKLAFEPVRIKPDQLNDPTEIKALLKDELRFFAAAAVIKVDGKNELIVEDEQIASELLEKVKAHYLPPVEEIELETVEIEEKVELETIKVTPEKVIAEEEALSLLINGVKTMKTHEVQEGESLWTIARDYGLWPEDLQEANPELEDDVLQIGQELKLIQAQPIVHVVTTWKEKLQESIPYNVKIVQDSALYRGQEKVLESGSKGQKELEYRFVAKNGMQINEEILSEKVIKEAEARVVKRGTRVMVASRGGGGGSGQLAWPIQGTITSGYGSRWNRAHEGIDIDGTTGDPVYAAEDGKVIFAGWSGGYGRLLTIDHGDGLSTNYAHLSGFKVSVGDTVLRGDIIALVGNTGRSTGSHLHFEVRVNGSPRNPLQYVR